MYSQLETALHADSVSYRGDHGTVLAIHVASDCNPATVSFDTVAMGDTSNSCRLWGTLQYSDRGVLFKPVAKAVDVGTYKQTKRKRDD